MSQNDRREDNSSMKRLAILLMPFARRLVLVVLMALALAALNMVIPAYFITFIIDEVFPGKSSPDGNVALLAVILPAMFLAYLARNGLYFLAKYTTVIVGETLCFTLRNRLFENLQQMNLQFYKDNKPGKISSRVMDDSFLIQTFIQDTLPTLLQAVFLFLGLIAVLYAVNWQLAVASTIVLPFHLAVYLKFKRPIKLASKRAQEQLAVVHGNLIEKFLAAEVVKGFTAEDRENRDFLRATDISRQNQLESKRYHVTQKIFADVLVGLGTIALLGFGAWQVLGPKAMTTGIFFGFFALVGKLYPTVLELMSGFAKLAKASASIDRVFDMLESDASETNVEGRVSTPIRGHIRFESVSFCYGDGAPVLKNVNINIEPGQVCAIVGPSGAGKSTMASLVPRFIEPDLGYVELDGVRLEKYDLRHLRQAVGIAFQECFLFNSSIRENLLYAKPDATMKQIVEVAKRTGAHELIMRLPDGYETVMGEQGVSLSRGEKQRVNLTRAMLKNPKILVLDEATASIDIASESQIIPNTLDFMRGKTTLMITHRPELLEHADIIVNLVEGRVVQQGPADAIKDELQLGAPSPSGGSPAPARDDSGGQFRRGLGVLLLAGAIGLGGGLVGRGPTVLAQDAPPPAEAAPATAPISTGKVLSMTGLTDAEVGDLIGLVVLQLTNEHGFSSASADDAAKLPVAEELVGVRVLIKSDATGVNLLRISFRVFRSQPPQLILNALQVPVDAAAKPADLIALVVGLVEQAKKTRAEDLAAMKAHELATKKIHLSYVETSRCLQVLKSFGITVIAANAAVDTKNLPVVMGMPDTGAHGLINPGGMPLTGTDAINHILVFYNPAQPEQFANVLDKVRNIIDLPARQIIIEAMVLEISEVGLERLGVEWELSRSHHNIAAGNLKFGRAFSAPTSASERPIVELTAREIFGEFQVELGALIEDNTAEVLSRPRVLTLDNRLAYISISRDIPFITSITNPNNSAITVNFGSAKAGITLHVRPHASDDGEEISMQITAEVSAAVPGEDVIAFNSLGDEVARKPTISSRQVKTYTRIANNTPFIIGGLIAKDDSTDAAKVPFLGDIPLIGRAFRNDRTKKLKREVIIVITPYVLPEDQMVSRTRPLDRDAFDTEGNKLFRDSLRIRTEDVFDLRFITENRRLQNLQVLADQVARRNADLAATYPFDRFAGGRIPGERILVYRQIYEVIKRKNIQEQVNFDRLIFFLEDPDSQAGFNVEFLTNYFASLGGRGAKGKFKAFKDKALSLTYTLQNFNEEARTILKQPVPKMELIDCPDENTWSRELWQRNQPDKDGKRRFTILIRNEKDLTRLKRAVVLKRTVELNVERGQSLTLNNYSVGRLLLMPAVKFDKVYLIDEETAKYFFYTELYYPAVRREMDRDMQAVKAMLRHPDVTPYLADPSRVDAPLEWAPSDR